MNYKTLNVTIVEWPDLVESEIFKYYPHMDEFKNAYRGKNVMIFNKELAKEWAFDYLYKKMTSKDQREKYGVPLNDLTGFIIGNTRSALRLEVKSKAGEEFSMLDKDKALKLISDHVDYAWEQCGYKMYE